MMTSQKARGTNSQVNFNGVSTKTSHSEMQASDIPFITQSVNLETAIVVMIILFSISVKSSSKKQPDDSHN